MPTLRRLDRMMMIVTRLLPAALFAIAPLLAVAEPVRVETAQGQVEIAARPETVAVFDIAALDTLARLGVRPAGVPERVYLPQLQEAAKDAKIVGNIFEPDLEALSALGPDLVIVGGRSSPRLASVTRVAPTIDMSIRDGNLVVDAKARLATYGQLFGREDEAAKAAQDLDAALGGARSAIAGKGRGLIIMTNGPKISAYGPGSRFGWLHTELGLEPASADITSAIHGEVISFEFIRKVDPDWLIVIDRAAAIGASDESARATLDNALVRATGAWQRDRVVYLPAADLYIAAGGVQAMTRVLETLTSRFARP
ncbi:siderophore ABC transporter substrate-binding protein [Terrihabitans sp. B22-R8]|uniref:siderophore ABC transporter substrate-binding protein n=1 Tax=Terrihabitans sp. B22-R8 TaxID=3425128 RepID=UPI00403C27D4